MKLDHKIYVLANDKGEDIKISGINNIKLVVNGFITDLYVIRRNETQTPFFIEADGDDNCIEGFSIFEKFNVVDGMLTYEDIHVTFFDEVNNQELLIKSVEEPGLLSGAAFYKHLTDAQVSDYLQELGSFIGKENTTETQTTEEGPVEVEVSSEEKTEEPVVATETKKEGSAEEIKTEEPVVATETKKEGSAEEIKTEEPPIIDQTAKQMEENAIPQEVLDIFEKEKEELAGMGYKSYSYKNYRFFMLPEAKGSDAFLLLLTNQGMAQVKPIYFCEEESNDTMLKYEFELDGSKKHAYLNQEKDEFTIKKVVKKKNEAKGEKTEVIAETAGETKPEEPKA